MRGAMIRAGNFIPTQTKPHLLTAAFFLSRKKKMGGVLAKNGTQGWRRMNQRH
jgi:hypothetical protein